MRLFSKLIYLSFLIFNCNFAAAAANDNDEKDLTEKLNEMKISDELNSFEENSQPWEKLLAATIAQKIVLEESNEIEHSILEKRLDNLGWYHELPEYEKAFQQTYKALDGKDRKLNNFPELAYKTAVYTLIHGNGLCCFRMKQVAFECFYDDYIYTSTKNCASQAFDKIPDYEHSNIHKADEIYIKSYELFLDQLR